LAYEVHFRAARAVMLAVLLGACSSHRDEPCPPNQPAFRLQVTAEDGVLPANLSITIAYGGHLTETYKLTADGGAHEDLCCRVGDPTRGALPDVKCGLPIARSDSSMPDARSDASPQAPRIDASVLSDASAEAGAAHDSGATVSDAATAAPSGPRAVFCDIWSGGDADVDIEGEGYPAYVDHFDADVPDVRCGVVVFDERVALLHGDASVRP
jgi:hypothetical protein